MTAEQLMTWATIIVSVGGAVGVILGIIRPLVKSMKKLINSLSRFTDDWFGEEATPGRDKVPGVMERLNNIDGELKHNGGSTMKDAVKRIEKKLSNIDTTLDAGNKRFDEIDARLNNIEKKDK
jgi:hypothetical protein